jgi:parallel beta-helix repeat protein
LTSERNERNRGKEMRFMRRTIPLLATVALTLLVASGLALAAGVGSAAADSSVVGPGESIQKAVYAADPGDTIIVRGVHREDVVIRKDGIKLRGDDAVIEAPPKAKADSPCSNVFGPEGICVLGDVDLQTGKISRYVKNVSISGFKISGFKASGIDVAGARDATVTKIRAIGNEIGIGTGLSVGTKILSNVVRGAGEVDGDGIGLEDSRDVTIAKNNVEGTSNGAAVHLRGDTNATVVNNDLMDNLYGTSVFDSTATTIFSNDVSRSEFAGAVDIDSTGTRILSNEVSRSGYTGVYVFGQKSQDAKLVGNNISGGPFGIYVEDAHEGSLVGNDLRDNCAGMLFEAFKGEPVGGFKVTGNTVADNTRSCRAARFDRNISGIGIALLGASGMEVTGNHLWGNVPTGPTPISGGVVVSKDPYFQDTDFGGTQKPTNNTVSANHFGRNKPDIFWDKSGSGNSFTANLCDTSVPTSLCN